MRIDPAVKPPLAKERDVAWGSIVTAGTLLAVYCLLIALISIAGGWVPLALRLTHRRMELAISFVAGAMLGVALLHLLPHAVMTRAEALEQGAGR